MDIKKYLGMPVTMMQAALRFWSPALGVALVTGICALVGSYVGAWWQTRAQAQLDAVKVQHAAILEQLQGAVKNPPTDPGAAYTQAAAARINYFLLTSRHDIEQQAEILRKSGPCINDMSESCRRSTAEIIRRQRLALGREDVPTADLRTVLEGAFDQLELAAEYYRDQGFFTTSNSNKERGQFFAADTGTQIFQSDIALQFSDLVTREFTTRFPPSRYVIAVLYNDFWLDGQQLCTATVGLAGRSMGKKAPRIPSSRYSAVFHKKMDHEPSVDERRECSREVIRSAVMSMMKTPVDELASKSADSM